MMSPTNSVPFITIVTLPLSRTLRTASSDSDGCNVSRRSVIAVRTGSRKEPTPSWTRTRRSDSSSSPTSLPLSRTGTCETSAIRIRLKAVSNVSDGPDGDNTAILVTSGDKVAQVTIFCSGDEALLGHPDIVVHLGEIFVSAVTREGHHAFGAALLSAIVKSRGKQSA